MPDKAAAAGEPKPTSAPKAVIAPKLVISKVEDKIPWLGGLLNKTAKD